MGRKGPRVRIAPGIYKDSLGYSAVVKVGTSGKDGRQRERRFQPTEDRAADLREMVRWQMQTRAELFGDAGPPTARARDSLAAAIPKFLATFPLGSGARHDFDKLLAHWLHSPLGARERSTIRRVDVEAQLARWEAAGAAPGTINHRLRALRTLFEVLDSDDDEAINPCAKIRKRREPDPTERGADYQILEGILETIPDLGFTPNRREPRPTVNKSKIRLRVIAWTGLPHALVKKIRPEHFDVKAKELDVTPRRKGKGVKARRLPLLPEAVAALKDLIKADACGTFSNAGLWKVWNRAKRRYLEKMGATKISSEAFAALEVIVTPLRPYDLRHSFATMVYQTTRSRDAVKDLLIHSSIATSERYMKRAVAPASRAAIAAVSAARAAGPVLVPAGASRRREGVGIPGAKRAISRLDRKTDSRAKSRVSSKKKAG